MSTNGPPSEKSDLGRHLSCLHTILFENISKIPETGNPKAERLRQLLDDINSILNRPTSSYLTQISQTTSETVFARQQNRDITEHSAISQVNNTQRRTSSTGNNVCTEPTSTKSTEKTLAGTFQSLFNHMGTLPKRNGKEKGNLSAQNSVDAKAGILSIPPPHHEQRFQNNRTSTGNKTGHIGTGGPSVQISSGLSYGPDADSIDITSSSSSNSLTQSPSTAAMTRQHGYNILDKHHLGTNCTSFANKKGPSLGSGQHGMSTISLDDTSSDDSTYSSQVIT